MKSTFKTNMFQSNYDSNYNYTHSHSEYTTVFGALKK